MKSIQDFLTAARGSEPERDLNYSSDIGNILMSMAKFDRMLPPWWSSARDVAMRAAWREDSMLIPAMMFAAQSKVANMPIRIVPRDPNVVSHAAVADELNEQFHTLSEYGEGALTSMTRFAEDWFGTDNGAFLEIVAPGDKTEPVQGVPLGIRHLDSLQCMRTSDPVYPVVYTLTNGARQPLHFSRVIRMSQMPSSQRGMNGVGYCAVSRSIELATRYSDMNTYIRGKLGGRNAKRLLVGKNISGRDIIKAILTASQLANAVGDIDTDTIAIGGQDVDIKAIDMHQYTELNELESTLTMMTIIALQWGLELQEIYPVSSSRSSAEVMMRTSRAKMPATFIQQLQRELTAKLVPPNLKVSINYDDAGDEQQKAIIADINARALSRMVGGQILSPESARRKLLTAGQISPEDHLDMSLASGKLADGTPIERTVYDRKYEGLYTFNPEFLLGESDKEEVNRAIYENRALIYSLYSQTNAQMTLRRYKTVLAVLNKLDRTYNPVEEESSSPNRQESSSVRGYAPATNETANENRDNRDEENGDR